jgi:hypothetical protein
VIESFGSTSLTEIGKNYYLFSNSTGAGPELKYAGAAVAAGQFGIWTPIGGEQTATGYEVAWKATGLDQYSVWTLDSNGNYLGSTAALSGTSATFEQFETSFHQDLNGDGIIGIPATTRVIAATGSTSLVEVSKNYFLNSTSSGSGPELKYAGAAVLEGQFSTWAPIAAVQTATGYQVAWKAAGADQYSVWTLDSNGNYLASTAALSGTSATFEQFETSFHQDLNGDGVIGIPATTTVIDASGATSLVEISKNYFLNSISGASGPELKYGGAPVVEGQFDVWTPFGAEKTSTGYEVAWKVPGTDQYSVWTLDSSGNYLASTPVLSGSSAALESFEVSFHQDLNGDGLIGPPGTVIEATGSIRLTLSQMTQDATIDAGASLELTGADSGSITFSGSTGTLVLDHSSSFTGKLLNLTGNGNASTSDQIDLRDIAFGAGTTVSYAGNSSGGILTIKDAQNHTAKLSLVGDYTHSTFSLSSDGNGGTLVIDPPKDNFNFTSAVPVPNDPITASITVSGAGKDQFVFHQPAAASNESLDGFAHGGFASKAESSNLITLANEAQLGHQWINTGHDVGLDPTINPSATHFAELHASGFIVH